MPTEISNDEFGNLAFSLTIGYDVSAKLEPLCESTYGPQPCGCCYTDTALWRHLRYKVCKVIDSHINSLMTDKLNLPIRSTSI